MSSDQGMLAHWPPLVDLTGAVVCLGTSLVLVLILEMEFCRMASHQLETTTG